MERIIKQKGCTMADHINWIKASLKQHYPDMDRRGYVDLNGDGKAQANERISTFAGNKIPGNDLKVVGDWTEWLSFFMANRAKLSDLARRSKLGGIFKWAGTLKATNPVHINQTLSLLPGKPAFIAKELREIEHTYRLICKVVDALRSDPDIGSKNPQEKLEAIYEAMENLDLTAKTRRKPLLHQNTTRVLLDPASSTLIAVAAAHEMGWPVHIVKSPDYIFVRWDDGKTKINIDQGEIRTDAQLMRKFNMTPDMVTNKIYMNNLDLKGQVALALRYAAEAYFRRDDMQTALTLITGAITLDRIFVRAHNLMGLTLTNLGRYQDALKSFMEVKRLNPNYAKAYANLAGAYIKLGNFDKAIENYNEAEKLDPTYPALYNNRGYIKYLKGRYGEAEKDFKEEIKRSPKLVEAYINRGLNYVAMKNLPDAVAYFRKGLDRDKDNALIHFYLGRTYFDQKDYANAVLHLKRAADLDPKSAVACYNLGLAYHELKQHANALAAYDLAIERARKNYGIAYFHRGRTNVALGKFDDARGDFVEARKLDGSIDMKRNVEAELKNLEARRAEKHIRNLP